MSLYVRVFNSFYTHRKTVRLRALVGEPALWIPPRLWAYAAENQPDGCFKDYSAAELAQLIGYTGNASRMLKALLQAGFLDDNPLRIHDWAEHNGYHKTYADRAKKGAAARWSKAREQSPLESPEMTEKGKERKGKEVSIASSNALSIGGEPALVVEMPSGFPRTAKDAQTAGEFLAIPANFCEHVYNKAVSRGGRDSRDVLIRNFTAHLQTEWKYERDRKAKEQSRGNGTNGSERGQPPPAVKGSTPVNGF